MSRRGKSEVASKKSHSFAKYFAAVVLCVVAVVQNIKSHTKGLTTWKGGGFGLFASHDQLRFYKVYQVSDKWREPLGSSKQVDLYLMRFIALPSAPYGHEVANRVHEAAGSDPGTWIRIAAFDIDYDVDSSVMSINLMESGDSRRH